MYLALSTKKFGQYTIFIWVKRDKFILLSRKHDNIHYTRVKRKYGMCIEYHPPFMFCTHYMKFYVAEDRPTEREKYLYRFVQSFLMNNWTGIVNITKIIGKSSTLFCNILNIQWRFGLDKQIQILHLVGLLGFILKYIKL